LKGRREKIAAAPEIKVRHLHLMNGVFFFLNQFYGAIIFQFHKIEESRGGVGAVLSEFAGLVVPGKSMMVVVPSLSSGQKRHD
jgi:hypothetical protein